LTALRRPTEPVEISTSPRPGSFRPQRELLVFIVVALLALVLVGAASVLLSARWARQTAVEDARAVAVRLADFVAQPLLEKGRMGALEAILDNRLTDGEVLLAQVWTPDQAIMFSTAEESENTSPEVSEELQRAFAGETVSHLDEDPETDIPGNEGPVLEVYAPFTVDGEPYVFEVYLSARSIEQDTALLRRELLPVTIGALIVLQAVQIPLALSMGRRLSRQEAERRVLVQDHLAASERERREIAADVHDGPVQDLAGVSYGLSALRGQLPDDQRKTVDRMVVAVRSAVASLRRLMVDIYPPDLSGSGLAPALEDLAGTVREKGIAVQLTAEEIPGMPADVAALLYRSSKEALANVAKHSEADCVWIDLERASPTGRPGVRLCVTDDGVGPVREVGDETERSNGDRPSPGTDEDSGGRGHLGLRLVRDRVEEAGGAFSLSARPEGGTVFCVDVPLDEDAPPR
jgi:two-component system, NarL family, sensor kinase